jgi:hypothetical protein
MNNGSAKENPVATNEQKLVLDINKLTEMIETNDCQLRNNLALSLSETLDERVYEALLGLIRRPELLNARGTLVHALKNFDCSKDIDQITVLVTEGNWEVAHEAFEIINSITEVSGDRVKKSFNILNKRLIDQSIEDWRLVLIKDLISLFE